MLVDKQGTRGDNQEVLQENWKDRTSVLAAAVFVAILIVLVVVCSFSTAPDD
jgi:hypothetical protein